MENGGGSGYFHYGDVTVREVRASCPRVGKGLVSESGYKVMVLLRKAQT
jgi:hypothetical protein